MNPSPNQLGIETTPAEQEADRLIAAVRGKIDALFQHLDNETGDASEVPLTRDQVLFAIWQVVKNDPDFAARFPGIIRRTTVQGDAAKALLGRFEHDPSFLRILAVGTVQLPEFSRGISKFFLNRGHERAAELDEKYGDGYDIYAKGPVESRTAFIRYTFEKQWGVKLEDEDFSKLLEQSAVLAGGMNAIKFIFEAVVDKAEKSGKNMQFVLPDNSFGTAWDFVGQISRGRESTVGHTKIETKQKNGLHLTCDEVDRFYDQNPPAGDSLSRMWYITPVGNPSGTSMTPEQLYDVCERIVDRDPNASMLLDEVYVGGMNPARRNALMKLIIKDKKIRERIIHLNSLSKSHGQCGRRVAMYTSFNKDLFDNCHAVNMLSTAGCPPNVYADAWALDDFDESLEAKLALQHKFWQRERKGLLSYLTSGEFDDVFHADQSHIREEDIEDCTTIYLCLRLRDDLDLRQGEEARDRVMTRTGCLGVPQNLAGGKYLRLSLGEISAPEYAKYAPDYNREDDAKFLAAA